MTDKIGKSLLLLTNPEEELVEAVCHHQVHTNEVEGRLEAAGGNVALKIESDELAINSLLNIRWPSSPFAS